MTQDLMIKKQTSSLAIISVVCGFLGLTFLPLIGSIIAVIAAPFAKREIRENPEVYTGEELAKTGQILGWVGLILFVVIGCCCLLTIILPLLAAFGYFIDFGPYIY
jgi:uncharacterized membrane protein